MYKGIVRFWTLTIIYTGTRFIIYGSVGFIIENTFLYLPATHETFGQCDDFALVS